MSEGERLNQIQPEPQSTSARDRFFAIVDELRQNLPNLPQTEIEIDVAEAIAAVRVVHNPSLPDMGEFRQRFQESLAGAGYGERDDILTLMREVRQERAMESGFSSDSKS